MRTSLAFVFVSLLALAGCAADTVGVESEDLRGRRCYSSQDCGNGQYCSTEDGDCFSSCRPNQPCIQVCSGFCQRDDREQCGDRVCPTGTECCNASCGTCVEPGGFCTQQICDSTAALE